jgi:excisionase family DNA binding protein
MFYTIQEVATKLGKTEDEIRQLVQEGKLREFRDGAKILFKVNEVDPLVVKAEEVDAPGGPASVPFSEESAISLTPLDDTGSMMPAGPGGSTSSVPIDLGDEAFDLSKADTQLTGEGLNVLGESDTEFKITDDTMGKTHAASTAGSEPSLEKIEEDVNLDSFGSGSGLLDLSLQADDTSLGGVLDEIYPGAELGGGEAAAAATPAGPMEVAAEAEQILTETAAMPSEPEAISVGYVEPEPDAMSNMLGLMLIVPLAAAIYTIIIAVAAMQGTAPTILTAVQEIVWYVMIGAAVLSLIIVGVGFVLGGKSKSPRTA